MSSGFYLILTWTKYRSSYTDGGTRRAPRSTEFRNKANLEDIRFFGKREGRGASGKGEKGEDGGFCGRGSGGGGLIREKWKERVTTPLGERVPPGCHVLMAAKDRRSY